MATRKRNSKQKGKDANSSPAAKRNCVTVTPLPKSKWAPKSKKLYDGEEDSMIYNVVHVDPNGANKDRMEGFGLFCTKYGENVITSPLFWKQGDMRKAAFLESAGCVNKACVVKDYKKDDGSCIMNRLGRETKGVWFLIPGIKEKDIREDFLPHYTDCLKTLPKHMRNLKDDQFPKLRDGKDYITVKTWDKVLEADDILFMVGKTTDNPHEFLTEKKSNLYNLFTKGKIPIWVMEKCGLNESHLAKEDWARLKRHQEQMEIQMARAEAGAYAANFAHESENVENNNEEEQEEEEEDEENGENKDDDSYKEEQDDEEEEEDDEDKEADDN